MNLSRVKLIATVVIFIISTGCIGIFNNSIFIGISLGSMFVYIRTLRHHVHKYNDNDSNT
jgi:H+/Cl- antiporter ClcA